MLKSNPANREIAEHTSFAARISRSLRRYFLTGLAALLPVVVTIGVVFWIDDKLGNLLGVQIPGLGIVATFVLILAVGIFTVHLFGRVVFQALESWLNRLPVVKRIYPAVKQLAEFLFGERSAKSAFRRVVLVQYPRLGSWSMGFVTNESTTSITGKPQTLLTLLIPQPPSPFTGPIIFIPEEEVHPLDMAVEDAIKMIVSGGVVGSNLKAAEAGKE